MSDKKYFAVRYDSTGEGCPIVLTGFFNIDEFEWEPFEPCPTKIKVAKNYELSLSGLEMPLGKLDFDYYQLGGEYVSLKFLKLCDTLRISYRAIPLKINLNDESRENEFFIFLPGESLAALDRDKSVFEQSVDCDTGLAIQSPLYSGAVSYDSVTRFVLSEALSSDLFRCQETLEIFCSEKFMVAAQELKGIKFDPIDESYRYDAWAEFSDL